MTQSCAGVVVVYEQDGLWSRALRRCLSRQVSVLEVVPFEPIEWFPDTAAITLAVVTGPLDAQATLEWARQAAAHRDRSLRMAIVRPADQELAWCLRETGVHWIWDEFWQTPRMAELIERFCRRHRRPDLSVEQRIWNNLPWNRNALGLKGGASHERPD